MPLKSYDEVRADYLPLSSPDKTVTSKVVTGTTSPLLVSGSGSFLVAVLVRQGASLAKVDIYDSSTPDTGSLTQQNKKLAVSTQGIPNSMDGLTLGYAVNFQEGLVLVCDQADAEVTLMYF